MRAITAVIAALAASVTADLNGSGQPGSPITSNHIDCKNSKMPTGTGYIYAAQVGFSYADGNGCNAIEATVKQYLTPSIYAWNCEDDGYGNTYLSCWTVAKHADDFTDALNVAFSAHEGGFDCTVPYAKKRQDQKRYYF